MFLTEVQRSIVRVLEAHEFIVGASGERAIPVTASCEKDFLSRMQSAVATLGGLAVAVKTKGGDFRNPEMTKVYYEAAEFRVVVLENITVNRSSTGTGQPADFVAEAISQILHQQTLTDAEGESLSGSCLICTGITEQTAFEGLYGFEVKCTLDGGRTITPERRDFSRAGAPE